MGISSARCRTPLRDTGFDHYQFFDQPARAEYLVRAWPDPRVFRRQWPSPEWFDFDPPRADLRAWRRNQAPWLIEHSTSATPRRAARAGGDDQLRLGFEADDSRVHSTGLSGFVESLPQNVRALIEPFRYGQFNLLRLSSDFDENIDLIRSNPALAFCLTDLSTFRGERIRNYRACVQKLLRLRQREALEWLGFPGRKSTQRLFRKIGPETASVHDLLRLRGALSNDGVGPLLSHCESVHVGVLRLVTDPECRPHLTKRFVHEVSTRDEEMFRDRMADLVIECSRILNFLGKSSVTLEFRNLDHARQIHAELAEALRVHRELAHPDEFEVPVPGNASITPVRNFTELKAWGRKQRNCCASRSYVRRLRAGVGAFYCVRARSEDATLLLERSSLKGWRMTQLLGYRNAQVSKETRELVVDWLQASDVAPSAV